MTTVRNLGVKTRLNSEEVLNTKLEFITQSNRHYKTDGSYTLCIYDRDRPYKLLTHKRETGLINYLLMKEH